MKSLPDEGPKMVSLTLWIDLLFLSMSIVLSPLSFSYLVVDLCTVFCAFLRILSLFLFLNLLFVTFFTYRFFYSNSLSHSSVPLFYSLPGIFEYYTFLSFSFAKIVVSRKLILEM